MSEKVVYTAVLGDTDPLKEPKVVDPDWQYVCFTDNPDTRSEHWQLLLVDTRHLEGWKPVTRLSREVKHRPHRYFPDATHSLWLDAAHQIRVKPSQLVAEYGDPEVCAFRHPERSSIVDEAEAIYQAGRDTRKTLKKQIEAYRPTGFLERQRHITSPSLLLRQHTPRVIQFNEDWHTETTRHSWRDQMSIDFCLDRLGIDPVLIHYHPYNSPYTIWTQYEPSQFRSRASRERIQKGIDTGEQLPHSRYRHRGR